MKFEFPLIPATILRKYKRFLVDFQQEPDSPVYTASTNSTGPMLSCWEPGWKILLSYHSDLKRKYPHALEMTHNGLSWIGVNTILPNRLVEEAISLGKIPEVQGYARLQREVTYGVERKSKIDFLLTDNHLGHCYIEVKCTNYISDLESGIVEFPDSRSLRAEKHLEELAQIQSSSIRSVLLFLVMREDCDLFRISQEKAPHYAQRAKELYQTGQVEFLAYQCRLNPQEISVGRRMEIQW